MKQLIALFFILSLSNCTSPNRQNEFSYEKKEELPQEISNFLFDLQLKNRLVMNESHNRLNIFIFFEQNDSVDLMESFFLDQKSDSIIKELIIYNFYEALNVYDTLIIVSDHEGYSEDLFGGIYTNQDLDNIHDMYSYEAYLDLNSKMIKMGYDKMILFDLASIKTGDEENARGIYDLFYTLCENEKNDLIDPRSIFDFLQAMRIVVKSYPNLEEDALELMKLLHFDFDTVVLDSDDIYDFVKKNYDSEFIQPW